MSPREKVFPVKEAVLALDVGNFFYCLIFLVKSKCEFFHPSRYINGTHYLQEKYGYEEGDVAAIMDTWFNLGISFVFPLGLFFLNLVLYLIPLPAFVKAKFRE